MENSKEPKKVVLSELKALVEEGKKMKDIAEFYGLPVNTTRNLLKKAGLKISRSQSPKFILIDDSQERAEVEDVAEVEKMVASDSAFENKEDLFVSPEPYQKLNLGLEKGEESASDEDVEVPGEITPDWI